MFLKNKNYVYKVYLEKSFSKAAKLLYISQPALSALVKKEEESLGTPIFDRSTNPISLTPAGRYYISSIEKIMEIENQLKDFFDSLSSSRQVTINIGSASYFCAYILPTIISKIKAVHPNYQINILETSALDLAKCLKLGTIDFALSTETYNDNSITCYPLSKEHIILAVPRTFKINQSLLKEKLTFDDILKKRHVYLDCPTVSIKKFSNEPFILLKRGNDIYTRANSIFKNANINPHILLSLDQMLTAYQIAKNQKGLTFLRAEMLHHIEPTSNLYFYKIDDGLIERPINLSFRNNIDLSEPCQNFLALLKSTPFDTLTI